MEQFKLVIACDHKAKIVRSLKFVCNEDMVFNLHPMFYAYAQLAETCGHGDQMTLVRMLMADHPTLSSAKAVIIADALMVQTGSKRLMDPEENQANQHQYRIQIEHVDVDPLGNVLS